MAVLADNIFIEKAKGAFVRCCGQADQKGVEVVEHLLPEVVDGAVALVDDDEVKKFWWNLCAVGYRYRLFWLPAFFRRVLLLQRRVKLLAFQNGVEALDGGDADMAVAGYAARLEPLHVVEFGKLAVVVIGRVGPELLLCLFAEVAGIDEKEYSFGVAVFEQAVDRGDGGKGFA